MKKLISAVLFFILFTFTAFATHQRAGEITYKWLSGLTYQVSIITYTYSSSPADRPSLEIFWGDGTSDIVNRVEQTAITSEINYNRYTYDGFAGGIHTYPAPGTYTMSMEDPNRNSGINNIPNSVNIPFYIETTLVINPFLGNNNSPILLNPPIDNACIYKPFVHNPWAYDPDGDSLSYRLDACKGAGGAYIPGYFYPPANNVLTINPYTGELLWDSPLLNGEYNICIIIDEWRHGIWIGSVRRDMQINVVDCENTQPVIDPLHDTCVLAGTFLTFTVHATDSLTELITLTGNGLPLLVTSSPASFPQPVQGYGSVSSQFSWQTECLHIKKSAYQMNFKAQDNGYPVELVDFASMQITVLGPAPENLSATTTGDKIKLKWDKTICTNAVGYRIYRRIGYYGFFPDHCETGVPAYTGYLKIAQLNNISDTTYLDDDNGTGLIRGNDYCYMVIAYYPDDAESYASLEACAQLQKDVPVITNVSIRNTDPINGSLLLVWSKPTEFDTIQIPGPYKYLIYQSPNYTGTNYTLIDSLASINDTMYIDTLINTKEIPYHYRIDFYNDETGNRYLIGSATKASSVYLSLAPTDNKIKLNWVFDVPWQNDYYVIYKLNPATSLWDSIGNTTQLHYSDSGLINGDTYCYYVKSVGRYTASGFAFPLINLSERVCGVPIDNVPPCPPHLNGETNCNDIYNVLHWANSSLPCADDVIRFNLYSSANNTSDYTIIFTTTNLTDTSFTHSGIFTIVGCYYVTAVDSNNNESAPSNLLCFDIDLCSPYVLPNVFTPNNDGSNDWFRPFPYNFVEKVNMQIFNRWGKIVFKTEDPDINWDGKDRMSKQDCSVGVYFYVCDVYERKLEGLTKRTLNGTIHLLR
ncbi:MAG: gliding motility-associated C-terminal domain-containing protein [Bacteroidota bacterium]